MRTIDTVYIDGQFVTPHGEELFDLFNPATEQKIGQVRLGDAMDAKAAVAAGKRAFPAYSRTTKAERISWLRRLHDAVVARTDTLAAAMIEEYGAPQSFVGFSVSRAADLFLDMAKTLDAFELSADPSAARRSHSSRSAWSPLSALGTATSAPSAASSPPPWPPAAPSSSSLAR